MSDVRDLYNIRPTSSASCRRIFGVVDFGTAFRLPMLMSEEPGV
jgi:hypothetical protein